jgi:FKBP-type peptidyl-prolyl cis-trans isomerase FklB
MAGGGLKQLKYSVYMKYAAFAFLAMGLVACNGGSSIAPKSTISTKADSTSYAIGVNIGSSFKDQDLEIDMGAFLSGIKDAMSDDSSAVKLTDEQLQTVFASLQQEMYEKQMAKMEEMSRNNLSQAENFLRDNATKEGVMVTQSGLQYKVITEGSGRKPSAESEVVVHYRGRLLDGTVFDSSFERGEPAVFQVGQVIDGWIEGLQLMNAGSRYEFYIPSSLAYGEQGNQVIPPNATLIFEVELIEVR